MLFQVKMFCTKRFPLTSFSTSEYTQTVKHLIDTHLADKLICKHILSKSNREYWSEREQEMELLTRALVDGGYADRAVAKYIFSKDVKNISYFPGERELKQRLLRKYLDPDRGIGIVVTPSLAVSNNRSVEQQCENLLAEGTLIRTRTVGILEITNLGGIGHTGIVYIARSLTSPSVQYALKIVIRYEPERVISMQREKKKMEFLQSIGVVHPKLIEDGDDYCIKEWVEGTIGVKWFEDWVESGHPVSGSVSVSQSLLILTVCRSCIPSTAEALHISCFLLKLCEQLKSTQSCVGRYSVGCFRCWRTQVNEFTRRDSKEVLSKVQQNVEQKISYSTNRAALKGESSIIVE
jgi:hypothetical protein